MTATFARPSSGVTATIINSLLGSVIETFDMMLECKAWRGVFELCEPDAEPYEVSAVITLTGRAKGVICLSFDRPTALEIAGKMLGETGWKLTPAVLDAIGEIANVIAGSAKSKLDMGLNMGLPMLVRRDSFDVRFPAGSQPMRLHLDSDLGPFRIDFGFVVTGM